MSSEHAEPLEEDLGHLRHEMGNHLGIISGHAQLLQMEDLSADVRASVDEIVTAASHLRILIKDMGRAPE